MDFFWASAVPSILLVYYFCLHEKLNTLTHQGYDWGCTLGSGNLCGDQCSPQGKYCNPDPDHDVYGGVSGVDVVNENLRQLCVWHTHYANQDGSTNPEKFKLDGGKVRRSLLWGYG